MLKSSRLVTETSPYFYDGSVANLDEAIKIVSKYHLGPELPDRDIKLVISFLESLVGEYRPFDQKQ